MLTTGRSSCGSLRLEHVGQKVCLAGWVDALRDHGDVLFIHLRDRTGVVQVVFSPEVSPPLACDRSRSLKNEFCIQVEGIVTQRAQGTENPHIDTGTVEVTSQDLTILSQAATLPFPVSEKAMLAEGGVKRTDAVAEDLRLQYRYLDLRRPTMQDNLVKRYRIIKSARDFLDEQGFIEVETPMLTKSTPEGARDYLVPSRHHAGKFYALPQSPQLFKQLLMVAGFERYFQVVRCFRDEDLRPNRQPEFTQLDIEASFMNEQAIRELTEELVCGMFQAAGISLPRPFPLMTYHEAMDGYGTDRPDLRFTLKFVDATDIFQNTKYGIFRQIIKRGGCIKGVNVRGQSDKLSKNILQNEYAKEIVPSFGAKGMTWMRVSDKGLDSNIVQFFSDEEKRAVLQRFKAQSEDVILMIADPSYETVVSALGQLRLHLGHRLGLIPLDVFCPVWITDFPLFEAAEGGVTSSHHPFTAPNRADFDPHDHAGLLRLLSRAYDLVVNGEELGGGSIRISDKELQLKIFRVLGLSEADIREKFGFFLQALEYGAPPPRRPGPGPGPGGFHDPGNRLHPGCHGLSQEPQRLLPSDAGPCRGFPGPIGRAGACGPGRSQARSWHGKAAGTRGFPLVEGADRPGRARTARREQGLARSRPIGGRDATSGRDGRTHAHAREDGPSPARTDAGPDQSLCPNRGDFSERPVRQGGIFQGGRRSGTVT